jgi:hypothetical protein
MSGFRAIACVCIALGALCAPVVAQAANKGGSGEVTTSGVGPLRLNASSPAAVRAFAGQPDHVTYWDRYGVDTTSSKATWAIWDYRFSGGGYARYSFVRGARGWVFEQFDTTLKRFYTARATRVGMTYAQAAARERVRWSGGCIDSGFWHYRDGYRFAVLVGVLPGARVHALHAIGPRPPLC